MHFLRAWGCLWICRWSPFASACFCFRDIHRGVSPRITLAVNSRKVLLNVSKEKYGKSKKSTKNFARNYDVVFTTSKQWMWRRHWQDDGGLRSAFQVLRMTGTEEKVWYAIVVELRSFRLRVVSPTSHFAYTLSWFAYVQYVSSPTS